MRPDASPDPAVETLEELADVGALVMLVPAPQEWVKCHDQLRGFQRQPPFGSLPDLVHKTPDRLRLGIRIRRTLSDLTTNLARRQMELLLPAPDFVAEELEALADVNNSPASEATNPASWIWRPSFERQKDFNPPEQRAAQRALPYSRPIGSFDRGLIAVLTS
jgi:hypothetical protein